MRQLIKHEWKHYRLFWVSTLCASACLTFAAVLAYIFVPWFA